MQNIKRMQQGHGIPAAREGHGDRADAVGKQSPVENRSNRRLDVVLRQPAHFAWRAVAAARVVTAAGALG